MFQDQKRKRNGGQILLITVLMLSFVLTAVVFGVASSVVQEYQNSRDLSVSKQAYYASESGVEDAIYRLAFGKNILSSTQLIVNGATAETDIVDIGGGIKTVESVGATNELSRKVSASIQTSTVGAAFSYGIQVGSNGVTMENGAGVYGNVYSNGNITGAGMNASFISGSAVAANSLSMAIDESNTVQDNPVHQIIFGDAAATQDLAQSFTMGTTGPLAKIALYIKRTSSAPGALTPRLMSDNAGTPGTQIATGSMGGVGTNFAWVDATFSTKPELINGTKYWIVLDGSTGSATRKYTIQSNTNIYADGEAKSGTYNSTWNAVSMDTFFKVYVGGTTGTISGVGIGYDENHDLYAGGSGEAWAHTVNNSQLKSSLYCKTGSGNRNSSGNPISCNTSKNDPLPQPFSISQAQVDQWKTEADDGTPVSGDHELSGTISIGPEIYTGNITTAVGTIITITGTVWIQGTFEPKNQTQIRLDPGYGAASGIMIIDGASDLSQGVTFSGSGTAGSFMLLYSTSDCPNGALCGGDNAIYVANNVGGVLLNAPNGTIYFKNGSRATEATASKIYLQQNAKITYDTGLLNAFFTSGPGGTFQLTSWQEVK